MSTVYDIDVVSLDDPYIHTAEEAGDSISETTIAGAFLVDIIPFRESSSYQRQVYKWSLLTCILVQ